ncbi:hypothetical protein BpHYR1_013817 [Brachionus plicatilis]|uniref:Uncharacterized protein n=1 Tax=Brachionus plicatilis TaxID=10195 RepID=A0A3M7SWH4_BRAPC|nr:hypothetical protein BpHYR1_013817 [Brachionus plicatilis]
MSIFKLIFKNKDTSLIHDIFKQVGRELSPSIQPNEKKIPRIFVILKIFSKSNILKIKKFCEIQANLVKSVSKENP